MAALGVMCRWSNTTTLNYQLDGIVSLNGSWFKLKPDSKPDRLPDNTYLLTPYYEETEVTNLGGFMINNTDEEPISQADQSSRRSRRQQEAVYVDVIALVEYSIYLRHVEHSKQTGSNLKKVDARGTICRYFSYVFNMVGVLYKTISSNINVRLVGYIIDKCSALLEPGKPTSTALSLKQHLLWRGQRLVLSTSSSTVPPKISYSSTVKTVPARTISCQTQTTWILTESPISTPAYSVSVAQTSKSAETQTTTTQTSVASPSRLPKSRIKDPSSSSPSSSSHVQDSALQRSKAAAKKPAKNSIESSSQRRGRSDTKLQSICSSR